MGFFDRFKKKEETTLVPGVGRMPYPAYRGREPYIFVSYAHADSVRVFREIARLNEAGYHVWYDEGIAPGNEWTDEIAEALANCSAFIVMLTPVSAVRQNVLNEINFALDDEKPFLAVHLEPTALSGGLRLRIGTKQAILKYSTTEEEYQYKLIEALNRFGLKRRSANAGARPAAGQMAPAMQEAAAPVVDAGPAVAPVVDAGSAVAPVVDASPTPAPVPQPAPVAAAAEEPPAKPSGYTLTPEDRLLIERAMNAEVRPQDFEWIGPKLKKFHGIQRRVEIPGRASSIMSEAFRGLPVEYVRLHEGIKELDFAAFSNCRELREAVIENPEIRINYIADPVAPIGAFLKCPKLVVYCHKGSAAYEELKRSHSGEIRFIEDMEE